MSRWLRAGTATALVDGLFSSILSAFFYGSSVQRLFQGVAAVPFGPGMIDGGWMTAAIGIALHICVAFGWSAIFVMLYVRSATIRRLVSTPIGVAAAAVVYGPLIWLTMSAVLIPLFTHRPPAITFRWWVQLVGHAPFVGLPILLGTRDEEKH